MPQPKIEPSQMDGSIPTLFGQNSKTTLGRTFGYYGGTMLVNGVLTSIDAGTIGPLAA